MAGTLLIINASVTITTRKNELGKQRVITYRSCNDFHLIYWVLGKTLFRQRVHNFSSMTAMSEPSLEGTNANYDPPYRLHKSTTPSPRATFTPQNNQIVCLKYWLDTDITIFVTDGKRFPARALKPSRGIRIHCPNPCSWAP